MSAPDGTLGGYLEKHDRPPAFAGSDGAPYSVAVYLAEDLAPPETVGGALLFVRWSDDGVQPVGHVETDVLLTGSDPDHVKDRLLAMTLTEVKECLDLALVRREELPDW